MGKGLDSIIIQHSGRGFLEKEKAADSVVIRVFVLPEGRRPSSSYPGGGVGPQVADLRLEGPWAVRAR